LEIASGFALAMTVFQPFRVNKTGTTFENPYSGGDCFAGLATTALSTRNCMDADVGTLVLDCTKKDLIRISL